MIQNYEMASASSEWISFRFNTLKIQKPTEKWSSSYIVRVNTNSIKLTVQKKKKKKNMHQMQILHCKQWIRNIHRYMNPTNDNEFPTVLLIWKLRENVKIRKHFVYNKIEQYSGVSFEIWATNKRTTWHNHTIWAATAILFCSQQRCIHTVLFFVQFIPCVPIEVLWRTSREMSPNL